MGRHRRRHRRRPAGRLERLAHAARARLGTPPDDLSGPAAGPRTKASAPPRGCHIRVARN
ncbi:hypothetical protein MTBUT4_410018 [Magnetospirillum sp. UT-4]|nr:hypothetical protein MTBUT4_410018 [Magnetospirillum sp. UT-4]